jgi:hypothetical protein
MRSRGVKQFAVMAMRSSWSKPRFVWMPSGQLLVFGKKTPASISAALMNEERTGFYPANEPAQCISVRWIVLPVWTETILP